MKHTPGPWLVADPNPSISVLVHTGSQVIAACPCLSDEPNVNENARLIAAAPDMLDALQAADQFITEQLHDAFYADGIRGEVLDLLLLKARAKAKPDSPHGKVIAAIAKATNV